MSEKTTPAASAKRSFKTISIWLPGELSSAARAVARHGRDIQNTGVSLLRSAFDSYRWDAAAKKSVLKCKEARPKGSAEALAAFNAGILALNAERAAKGSMTRPLESLGQTVGGLARVLLDPTLFERVLKARPDLLASDQRPAFGRLPSRLARGFGEAAREGFSTWLKSVTAWGEGAASGAGGAGRPQPPGYQAKGSLPPIEMADFGRGFPKLAGKALFKNEAKSTPLRAQEAQAWDAFELHPLIDRALKGRWGEPGRVPGPWAQAPDLSAVKALRILIQGKRARLQLMVEVDSAPPPGSFYAELAAREPELWGGLWAGKSKGLDAWLGKIASGQDWAKPAVAAPIVSASTSRAWISQRFSACGIDLGISNVAAVAFSDGAKGAILSGRQIDRSLGEIDAEIDAMISRLTGPEQRGLQAKRDAAKAAGAAFPLADARRLRELSAAVHRGEEIQSLRARRARVVKNFAHQTAARIASLASGRNAALAIVGRNLGWKSESDLGKKQNRRFHRIPHGLIIVLLREKLDALGIGLIETEESWTSAASFADHDPLSRPGGKAPKAKKNNKAKKEKAAAPPPALARKSEAVETTEDEPGSASEKETEGAGVAHSARRGEGRERDWLLRRGPWPRAASRGEPSRPRVHADLNGAFNMIRKASPKFAWSERVSLKHEVWSVRAGDGGFAPPPGYKPPRPKARV